jgi:hypothetical protein
MSGEHRVTVVVDPAFSSVLAETAVARHVWVVRTPQTEKIAERVWLDQQTNQDQWNDAGLTLFNGGTTPEASLISILGAVELHHGESSHDPPLSVIEVLGVEQTPSIRQALVALGFTETKPMDDGFIARRAA